MMIVYIFFAGLNFVYALFFYTVEHVVYLSYSRTKGINLHLGA